VTFWGERYLDWFCRYSAASLLGEGNIEAISDIHGSRFLICTPREDWETLQQKKIFQKLQSAIDIIHLELPELPKVHKYSRMSLGHKLLMQECHNVGAIAIYLAVDSIIPSGSVRELMKLSSEGKKTVLCTAIRFEMEGITRELEKRGIMCAGEPLTISRREAVDIGLRNLHPESLAGDFSKPYFGELAPEHGRNHLPTCCYWKVPNEGGAIIITHNWSPFLIDYRAVQVHDTSTLDVWAIDGDYIYKNFKKSKIGSEIHVVNDSDSLFLLGLTPRSEMNPNLCGTWWKASNHLGNWLKGLILYRTVFDPFMDPLRREIYPIQVYWHSKEISSTWNVVQKNAIETITKYCFKRKHQKLEFFILNIFTNYTKPYLAAKRCGRLFIKIVRGEVDIGLKIKTLSWGLAYFFFQITMSILRKIAGQRIANYWRTILKALLGETIELQRIKKRISIISAKYFD
jgi:hypothetical protein